MARRRVVEETKAEETEDEKEARYDREEREAIQDEPKDEKPARRRAAIDPEPEREVSKTFGRSTEHLPPASPLAGESGPLAGVLAGQEVTVVWGEELFSPQQFHTFKVGPFTATTRVLPGETFEKAAERAMGDLRLFAEKEREKKRASYLRMVETTSKRG